jgi:transposase
MQAGPWRASMVARARLIEDLVADRARDGVAQYVILGAGLDTFALRHAQDGDALLVSEVDQPATQHWKRARMRDLGLPVPDALRFVPFDFESGGSWVAALRTPNRMTCGNSDDYVRLSLAVRKGQQPPWFVPDELWARVEPLLPAIPRRADHPGRRRPDDRRVLCGILFVLYTGIPWEFLPQELGFGSGMTCWRRLRDWRQAGVWQQLHEALLADLNAAGPWTGPGR